MSRENGNRKPPVIEVLGAGPAGIAAAYALARTGKADIEVLERAGAIGGNSASFRIDDIWCDYGSHRFHPVADPHVLEDVKRIMGDDLLLRPRHGRIRLGGRWIHFPLKPLDALVKLPRTFALSLLADSFMGRFRKPSPGPRTFSSVLLEGLGPTISENFYFPYVKKLWGVEPEKLAVKLAERRISGNSVSRILLKMMRMLPGLKGKTTGRFYYPRQGFGQISQKMAEAARSHGARFRLNTEITRIERQANRVTGVWLRDGDKQVRRETTQVLSTIPLTALVALMDPPPPPEVVAAARKIRFRGMILLYLVLECDRFTEFDAHYYPELSIPISRMSEPKNYNGATAPRGVSVLCAELPADPGDRWWNMSDEELGKHFTRWLAQVDLPVNVPVRRCETRRLAHAYPVYDLDYEPNFRTIDDWFMGLDGLLVFGRQGLFAHDNTHHAFAMAYGAADCLDENGQLDRAKWESLREVFSHHTVED